MGKMTSSIDDSRRSSSVREEVASLLDNASKDPSDVFETILERVQDRPARDVEHALESVVEEDRDLTDVLPKMLDGCDVEPYLSDGSDSQRALITM
jgi:hypothetical protein